MVIKKQSAGKVISVNFTDVASSGAIPDDNYIVVVDDVTKEDGPKAPYLNFVLKVVEGPYKGRKLWHTCTLSPNGLWNLRATLEALGVEVPQSKMNVDLPSLKGLQMGVTTETEIYKKKPKSKVTDVFSLTEASTEEGDGAGETTESEEVETVESSDETKSTEEAEGDTFTLAEAEEHWTDLKPVERTALANGAGLEGKWGKKVWSDLSDDEKATLYNLAAEEEPAEETEEEAAEAPDLDAMNLKELLDFADKNEIELTADQKKFGKKAREAIKAALA